MLSPRNDPHRTVLGGRSAHLKVNRDDRNWVVFDVVLARGVVRLLPNAVTVQGLVLDRTLRARTNECLQLARTPKRTNSQGHTRDDIMRVT